MMIVITDTFATCIAILVIGLLVVKPVKLCILFQVIFYSE